MRHFFRDLLLILLIGCTASFILKTFLVRTFYIPSQSMENTLRVNDRIMVNQLVPGLADLRHGDIVVFEDPGGWLNVRSEPDMNPARWLLQAIGFVAMDSDNHLVKRVIGLPGDHVECCNALGQLMVNGVAVEEPYLSLPTADSPASGVEFDVVVPEDSLWVMGDSRYRSADSRFNMRPPSNGFVPYDRVIGRAFLVNWPLDHFTFLPSYEHLFQSQ